MVKDTGYVYVGGPPLVAAATGEVVTDEELGGAEVHTKLITFLLFLSFHLIFILQDLK